MAKRGSEDTFYSAGQNSKKVKGPNDVSLKFLLPNIVVGALLSRKAAALKKIRAQTCHSKEFVLKISGKDQFYPGTENERMVAIAGPPPMVHRACCLLQDQIIDDPFLVNDPSGVNEMGPRQGQMIIAVSDRAASKIIGSRGAVVKDISGHFNIAISITPTKEVIVPDERVVTIVGPSQNVFDALDPIIYQISQQEVHINPEFDYYSKFNNSNKDEIGSIKEENNDQQEEQDTVKEMSSDENAVKEDPQNEDGLNEKEPSPTDIVEEPAVEDEAGDKTTEEKTADEEQITEKIVKTIAKKTHKDGRWVWQSERNSRSKWVWIENQKNSTHVNHSQGAFRGSRAGGYGSSGRGGRW